MAKTIHYREGTVPDRFDVLSLYQAVGWSAAAKPDALMAALDGSDYLVTGP